MALHVDPLKRELLEARIQGTPSPNVATQTGKSQNINSETLPLDDRPKCGTSNDSVQNTADVATVDAPIALAAPPISMPSVGVQDGHPTQCNIANLLNSLPNSFHVPNNPEFVNSPSVHAGDDHCADNRDSSTTRPDNHGSNPSDSAVSSGNVVETVVAPLSNNMEENSQSVSSASGDGIFSRGIVGGRNYSQGIGPYGQVSYGAIRQTNIVPYSNTSAVSNQSLSFDMLCQPIPLLPPSESPGFATTPKKSRNISAAPVTPSQHALTAAKSSGLSSPVAPQPATPRASIRRKRKGAVLDEQGPPQPKRTAARGNKRIDEIFKVI